MLRETMAISYTTFFALYSASMVIGIFVGLLILVGWKDMFVRKALASAKYNAIYLAILIVFPLTIAFQEVLAGHITHTEDSSREIVYTNWIFGLSGGAVRMLQVRLDYKVLTEFFILTYVWFFTFLLMFSPMYR